MWVGLAETIWSDTVNNILNFDTAPEMLHPFLNGIWPTGKKSLNRSLFGVTFVSITRIPFVTFCSEVWIYGTVTMAVVKQ